MASLIERIQECVADPLRAVDAADWVRPAPVAEWLIPVAPSLEGYLEAWLADERGR